MTNTAELLKNDQTIEHELSTQKQAAYDAWVCERLREAEEETKLTGSKSYTSEEVWAYIKAKYGDVI
jgi:hypothetical protein